MPQVDIESHAGLLIVAGSETTATLLSGCTFLLLNNPDALDRLTKEVRSTFKEESEININSAGQLQYMLACLDEALRCYPPVPIGNPRVVPKGGRVLCGHYVPEDVSCQSFPDVDTKKTRRRLTSAAVDPRRNLAMGDIPLRGQLRRAIQVSPGEVAQRRQPQIRKGQERGDAAFLLWSEELYRPQPCLRRDEDHHGPSRLQLRLEAGARE